MAGAPSHLELFDNKPQLAKFDGTLPPPELLKGYRAAFINPNSKLLGPKFKFAARQDAARSCPSCCRTWRGGRRHRHRQVDGDRRLQPRARAASDEHRHAAVRPAEHGRVGALRPGPRVARTCPASSSSAPARRGRAAAIPTGAAAFCPRSTRACSSAAAATRCCIFPTRRASTRQLQRDSLDALKQLNQMRLDVTGDPEIATRINSFEMAFRMQAERAGADGHRQGAARRRWSCTAPSRASRRSPTTACWPAGWWSAACASCSSTTRPGTSTATWWRTCRRTAATPTRPAPALIKDLKQRGLLDDTLVIWGGEFGRTPMVQGGDDGRDHHPNAFTMWLAGGGIKPGITHRRDRRARLQRRRGPGPRPRPARHDAAPAGLRPHQADLPVPGPRLPADRRGGRSRTTLLA